MQIITQKPIPGAEVKEELDRIKKRDGELGFRANKTVEYFEQTGTLKPKKAQELMKKLEELNVPRLRDLHFSKLADVLPATTKDVKTILQGYSVTVTNENCKKIADVVAEYV